jgi:hypothetical protein
VYCSRTRAGSQTRVYSLFIESAHKRTHAKGYVLVQVASEPHDTALWINVHVNLARYAMALHFQWSVRLAFRTLARHIEGCIEGMRGRLVGDDTAVRHRTELTEDSKLVIVSRGCARETIMNLCC